MSRGRGSSAVTRSHVATIACGIYCGANKRAKVRLHTVPLSRVETLKVVRVDGKVVASGISWEHCYSNLHANAPKPAAQASK